MPGGFEIRLGYRLDCYDAGSQPPQNGQACAGAFYDGLNAD